MTTQQDSRGLPVSGATRGALDSYEQAVDRLLAWQSGTEQALAAALEEAPSFAMARIVQAYLMVCSRDPQRVRAAQPLVRRAAREAANDRERSHLGVIGAVLADDFVAARTRVGALLDAHPRDLVALHVAHSLDHATGDVQTMRERTAAALRAASENMPGYHAVLSMHAFGLAENGEPEQAEAHAQAALALNPTDARAHHAMAHAFETEERADAGLRWMRDRADGWSTGTVVATHGWWHAALFCLALGDPRGALRTYDEHVRGGPSSSLADLIDASSLLWRIGLESHDVGDRWTWLAEAWAAHIDDRYCSFSDVHAMLAFVGAHDWGRAEQLEATLTRERLKRTRHGDTTRQLGLSACRGLMAYGRGDLALSIALLASLPAHAHRLGGSHAQRDVLHLTLVRAVERMRRPARRHAETLVAFGP